MCCCETRVISTGGGGGAGGLLETAPGHLGPDTATETDVSGLRDTGQTAQRVEVVNDSVVFTPNGVDTRVYIDNAQTWIAHPDNQGDVCQFGVMGVPAFGGALDAIAYVKGDISSGVNPNAYGYIGASPGSGSVKYDLVGDPRAGGTPSQATTTVSADDLGAGTVWQATAQSQGAGTASFTLNAPASGLNQAAYSDLAVVSQFSDLVQVQHLPDEAQFSVECTASGTNPGGVTGAASLQIYAGDSGSGPIIKMSVNDLLGNNTQDDQAVFVERNVSFNLPDGSSTTSRTLARTKLSLFVNTPSSVLELKADDGVVMASIGLAQNPATGNYELVP